MTTINLREVTTLDLEKEFMKRGAKWGGPTLKDYSTGDLIQEVVDRKAPWPTSFTTTEDMLITIKGRGGHPGALAEAALLCAKKSQDYNNSQDLHNVDRDVYFPFGTYSYAHMIHTKSQRFVSLTQQEGKANFEGLRDTALDLINYAGFYVAWVDKEKKNA